MPLIDREDFDQFLAELAKGPLAPIYLLHGEGYLVTSALGRLTDHLIPESKRQTNLQVIDSSQADFKKILDSLNTFALFVGRKTVIVQDCRIFYSRADLPSLLAKCRDAYEGGERETAARYLLEVIGYAGWSLADLAAGAWRGIPAHLWQQIFGKDRDEAEMAWLDMVLAYAEGKEMKVPERGDDASLLETALRRGFPPDHCLVLTTDKVDKRRSLYALIEEKGVVVDFSVASGSSRQARSKQDAVLKALAREVLAAEGKEIAADALGLLMERSGFNLWFLKNQLQKLVAFAGVDPRISLEQVESMTSQVREEALFELNNAVASNDTVGSLTILDRLLDQGYHPLQVLASLSNEMRRLILARDFIDTHLEGRLNPDIAYAAFQKTVYPLVKERSPEKSPLATLHPFALHKTMVRCASVSSADLVQALQYLFEADVTLKSTGLPQRAVMESTVIRICKRRYP